MGRGFDAICNQCGTKFQVNEGSGTIVNALSRSKDCGRAPAALAFLDD